MRGDGDALGAIHGGTAAHGQHDVDVLATRQLNALAHEANLGVGAHAAQLYVAHARSVERILDALERAGAYHGALSVHDERALVAGGSQLLSHAVGHAASKDELGGRTEGEVVHTAPLQQMRLI